MRTEAGNRNSFSMNRNDTEKSPLRRAVLVGMRFQGDDRFDKSMEEMDDLAEAAGMEVVDTFTQDGGSVNPGTFIGPGKITEVRNAMAMENAKIVLFNNALTPMQMKNLVDAFDAEIIDRTGLILQIFDKRARTREARLQVESARLSYILPRLAGFHKELGRQGGASGAQSNKGAGETQIELDRRRIEHRMTMLRRELEVVERERTTQRGKRASSGIPRVALVGYTNAGKSTILNRMLDLFGTEDGKKVLEEDMLFATLDTTVRAIVPDKDRRPFLLSDTVGFIDDLPTTLVKAFRSTLDETRYAELLLLVSDISDPSWKENLEVTEKTLKEIGAGDIPRIYVLNKCDLAGVPADVAEEGKSTRDSAKITMSARNPRDIDRLITLIEDTINKGRVECTLLIPYADGKTLAYLRGASDLTVLDYTNEGTLVHAYLRHEDAGRFAAYFTDSSGAKRNAMGADNGSVE